MAYELKCPYCQIIFKTNPKLIYSETKHIIDDMTRQDALDVDCPGCKAHLRVYAKWVLDLVVCKYETASESKTYYSEIDRTSDRSYSWEEME